MTRRTGPLPCQRAVHCAEVARTVQRPGVARVPGTPLQLSRSDYPSVTTQAGNPTSSRQCAYGEDRWNVLVLAARHAHRFSESNQSVSATPTPVSGTPASGVAVAVCQSPATATKLVSLCVLHCPTPLPGFARVAIPRDLRLAHYHWSQQVAILPALSDTGSDGKSTMLRLGSPAVQALHAHAQSTLRFRLERPRERRPGHQCWVGPDPARTKHAPGHRAPVGSALDQRGSRRYALAQ